MNQLIDPYNKEEKQYLSNCILCPRACGVNRFTDALGFCKSDARIGISSVCCHKGEEPVISGKKGICNIFFSRCNLQCNFCQNFEISRNKGIIVEDKMPFRKVMRKIFSVLEQTENIIGFVSPSHQVPQMTAIIRELHQSGRYPVIVYNTNAYDRIETLRMLEGMVNVYLPDFKYSDSFIAGEYSKASDYPEIAGLAIKEMYRQKGSSLILNNEGIAEWGIIVRHLVLPGAVKQSIETLRYIAAEITPDLHISLMSQYYPTSLVSNHPVLNRNIKNHEFKQVINAFHRFGFHRGWIQEMGSHAVFRPDFSHDHPFL